MFFSFTRRLPLAATLLWGAGEKQGADSEQGWSNPWLTSLAGVSQGPCLVVQPMSHPTLGTDWLEKCVPAAGVHFR